jgi:large subunit ribosomal protein L29
MAKKKTNTKENLAEMHIDSLKGRIAEDQLRLKKMQFAHAMTPLENPMMIRGLRRGNARLQTELSKRK